MSLGSTVIAELITGKSGHDVIFFSMIDSILTFIFITAADTFEDGETWSGGSVGVNVNDFATLDILEKSHRCVPSVVLDHVRVLLAFAHVKGRMLEDAALTIVALGWALKKILTHRSQVLPAESLFLLQFFLSMSKATSLFLLTVFALLAIQPEPAELSLHLLLPSSFSSLDTIAISADA